MQCAKCGVVKEWVGDCPDCGGKMLPMDWQEAVADLQDRVSTLEKTVERLVALAGMRLL